MFSTNFEAFASELLANLEEMFPHYLTLLEYMTVN